MEERCSQLEKARTELEKQLAALRAELDEERRDRNLRTETIADLQGEFQNSHGTETSKINPSNERMFRPSQSF